MTADASGTGWVGRSLPRIEDASLLTGRGRYIDDLGVPPGTLHAAILRSPHAHAEIAAIDIDRVRAAPGVAAVLTEQPERRVNRLLQRDFRDF